MTAVPKPVVLIAEQLAQSAMDVLGTEFEIRHVDGADRGALLPALKDADAILIRSATTMAAEASVRAGDWKRSKFTGVEIADKTVGVVGLGRIGQLFAARVAAFGTTVIAYDPYLQPARAAALGVRLVDLPTLLATADIISIHLPRTRKRWG